MRVKIISDGTVKGTEVVDIATGKPLEGLVAISWDISVKTGLATAIMKLHGVSAYVVGEVKQ